MQLWLEHSLKKMSPGLLEFILMKSFLTSRVANHNPRFLLLFEWGAVFFCLYMNIQMEKSLKGPRRDVKLPCPRGYAPRSPWLADSPNILREWRFMALGHLCHWGSDVQAQSCSCALVNDLIFCQGHQHQVAEDSRRDFLS